MRLPKPSDGGDFLPVPAGTWPAICYRVIDLGTQRTSYLGEAKDTHQVMLSFELKDDECLMREGPKAGLPMTMHQTYTWSMHEKAKLRKALESWRGKKFSDADFGDGGFDVRKLLGVPCMLSVIHNEKDGGKVYANIGAIMKPPKGMLAGELVNPTMFIALVADEFDRDAFASLPDRLKQKIMDSPEYQRLAHGGDPGPAPPSAYEERSYEQEIPF
jgi:hypothetical protein